MRFASRGRGGVSSIVGSIFFVLIMIVAVASLVTMFNSFTAYNKQVNGASSANALAAATSLSVTGGTFGAYPPASPANFNVGTSCQTTSTFPTDRESVFYAANMWWDFFTCNGAFQYSTSFDGVTWQAETSIPSVITAGFTVGPYFDVEVVGTTVYLAIARVGNAHFQYGVGTLAEGGTDSAPAGTISWSEAPAQVATTANAAGPINIAIDASGNQWVVVVQGTCTTTANCALGVYEHEACATASAAGWEPNACGSATNPNNYAPTSLGTLGANAQAIVFPAMSSYSTTGAVIIYETGSATNPSTGSIGVVTQSTLASTAWTAITLSGVTDYSLTSSSAVVVGSTVYFAGLENAAVGQTTGAVKFWSLSFSSMAVASNSAETTMESTTRAWQAALTYSGNTLVLFDNPATGTIQYYSSSTLGSVWNSPAISLVSSETAINGLSPASGAFAVTWADSGPSIRFAALSTFTVTNDSPFGVHLVDLYVYQPSTSTLAAHYYYNSTEDFDYWLGQGTTTSIPIRFIWSANTTYLVTFGTDNGVTAQLALTSLPGGTVSCPSGEFFNELSPQQQCSPAPGDTNPVFVDGSGLNTCTDASTSAEFMGLNLAYTTSPSTSGNMFLSFTFQIASPATTTINSAWQLVYGSGTAPTCGLASGFTGSATAIGEVYTVRTQAANVRQLSQSISATLSGLAPSTTYWFDIEATDSTAGAWTYSNPHMTVEEALSSSSPLMATSASTNSCSITSGATGMGGLGTTFTTGGSGFSGTVIGELTFNIASAGTGSATSTAYTVRYGTGAAPGCHAGATGTTASNTYTFVSESGTTGRFAGSGQKVGFVLSGLTASTTYWVDVQETDSSGTPTWVYSNPTLATMVLPSAGSNSLPTAASSANTSSCSVVTAGNTFPGYAQTGFGLHYTIPTSATGDLMISLTFEITIPTTTNVGSVWQASYGSGLAPTCNSPPTGSTIGQSYQVTSPSGVAGGREETETMVIPEVQKIAGTAIWIDLQVADTSTATWTYSNPAISVAMFPS